MIVPYAGFVGGTYRTKTPRIGVEQALNIFPIVHSVPGARPPFPMTFRKTPGTNVFGVAGGGPVTTLFEQDGRCVCISGSQYIEVFDDGTTAVIGDVATSGLPSAVASSGTAGGQNMVVSGGAGYIHTLSNDDFVPISDLNFPANVVTCGYSDGYFVVAVFQTRDFAYSDVLNGIIWPAANAGQKLQSSDNILNMVIDHKELWFLGTKSIEPWGNTGAVDTTFQPIQGVLIEHGIGAFATAVKVANTIAWLGADTQGGRQAWYAQGYQPVRFSHDGVEQIWATYTRVDDAYAWAYHDEGHTFYVINFPTPKATWVYDFTTQMWHERGYLNPATGRQEHHLGRCHAFAFGKHLVGSRIDGTIYELTQDAYYDNDDEAIRRVRRAPHVFSMGRDITINRFEMRADTGVATATGQGSEPRIMFRYSVNGGMTYSDELLLDQGEVGDYDKRVGVDQLGQGNDWVLEAATSEPLDHTWGDAVLDAEGDEA